MSRAPQICRLSVRTFAVDDIFDTDPNYAVYIVGADGNGERRLTPRWGWPRGAYSGPDWSPNGRKIAFTHVHKGAVYVIRPDGSGRRALASMKWSGRTWRVKWSPDGRLIAFVSDDHLWVMNADGTQPRKLAEGRVDNRGTRSADFAWSPDSRQIAFTQCCREDEIFIVNADGSGLLQLIDNDDRVFDGHPTWSPDGRAIAFTSDRVPGLANLARITPRLLRRSSSESVGVPHSARECRVDGHAAGTTSRP